MSRFSSKLSFKVSPLESSNDLSQGHSGSREKINGKMGIIDRPNLNIGTKETAFDIFNMILTYSYPLFTVNINL